MNSFLILLLLVCFVSLIVSLVKPSLLKLKSRKQGLLILGSSLIVIFILVGVTTEKKNSVAPVAENKEVKAITSEDKIKSSIAEVNLVKLSFGSIEKSVDEASGGQVVTVNMNVADSYSKDQFFKKTGKLSSEIYQTLFSESDKVAVVIIQYQGEKVDEFGKTSMGNFLVETLDKSTYEKIVWENFNTDNLCEFLRKNNKNSKGELVNFCSVFVSNLR